MSLRKAVKKKAAVKGTKKKAAAKKHSSPQNSRSSRFDLITKVSDLPITAVVYGPPGIGKSEFVAYWPDPVFIIHDDEQGILTLKERNPDLANVPVYPPVKDYEEFLEQLHDAAHIDCKTVCVESLGPIDRMINSYVCHKHYRGDWSNKGMADYQSGFIQAADEYWPHVINAFKEITAAGKHLAVTGHSVKVQFDDPETASYSRYECDLKQRAWQILKRWSECILFLSPHVELENKETRRGGKQKPKSRSLRYINTQWTAAYDAKNRYGLSDAIQMGDSGKVAATNFFNALKG